MRKEYDIIGDSAIGCLGALIILMIPGFFGYILIRDLIDETKANKQQQAKYDGLEVKKYSADTIEVFFRNPATRTEFYRKLKEYNITTDPGDKMHLIKQYGDTIRIKFDDKRFQRQFEKQWNKYRGYKLGNINSKKVCNAKS